MKTPIKDRATAGRALAEALTRYKGRDDVIVLALPRGGVPVAYEVSIALSAPMDLMLVRKLGTPHQKELAMGAIAMGGARILNEDVIKSLLISDEVIEQVAQQEQMELERRLQAYRGDRPLPEIRAQYVILVDDGIATGATMRAAIAAIRQLQPARIIVAIPLAPLDTLRHLKQEADEVICLATPEPFWAIGRWYESFPQLSDNEVRDFLSSIWKSEPQTETQAG